MDLSDLSHLRVERDEDAILVVSWDSPGRSMNVFTQEVMAEIERVLEAANEDDGVKGVVFTSAKKEFSGGADLSMLQGIMTRFAAEREADPTGAVERLFAAAGAMSALWRRVETGAKPWVAAINGVCLGGAFELALSCHGRVVSDGPHVSLALPEVKVGIFPGAGGTQRVARLADTQGALEMLTSGRSLTPAKAKALNLVHAVVPADGLIEAAKRMIRDGLKPVAPWDEKGFRPPGGPVYSAAGAALWPPAVAILRRETYGNYPGVAAVLKCVYEGLLVPFDTGLRIEQRYFTRVLQSAEAAAMVRSLFVSVQALNKGARRPAGVETAAVTTLGVVGAGFMGAGIAAVAARSGVSVVLLDLDAPSVETGRARVAALYDEAVKKKRMTADERGAALARVAAGTDYSALGPCELVIEAVFEDSSIKRDTIERIEAAVGEGAVVASNTSTIPITALAQASVRPQNVVGLHFFSPVDRMALVEVIRGAHTSARAQAVAFDFVRRLKKTPILVEDTRGFYVNRCVLAYMGQAYRMLSEGVPAAMIENAARAAGMPVGPLALADETAIDLAQKILRQTARDLGEKAVDAEAIRLVDTMVDTHGRLGRKNGRGFYDYPAKPAKKTLWPGLRELYPQRDPDEIDVEEVKNRFLVAIALEAARVMEEGILSDPREADVGSILAFGFAPYTGGALSFIDGLGLKRFERLAHALEKKHGKVFKAPKLVKRMAESGETFYGRFTPSGPSATNAA